MYLSARQTGRTTKLLLELAQRMLKGERVLVVLAHQNMIHNLQVKLTQLFQQILPLEPLGSVSGHACHVVCFQLTGGTAFFTADIFSSSLRGMRFDSYLSDPGDLEPHELAVVLPLMVTPPPAPKPVVLPSGPGVTISGGKKVYTTR